MKKLELTILIPCYNEQDTIVECVSIANRFLEEFRIDGEVLVVDNHSTDQSFTLAKEAGARVVIEEEQGYGSALQRGNKEAKGKYVIMGDADCSYDFSAIYPFLESLRSGKDIVVGNRFLLPMEKGAMKFSHKYIGNPFLSSVGRKLFSIPVSDFHCGLRGYDKNKILDLNLECKGMDYASEMIIKAKMKNYSFDEIPIVLHKDKRKETSSHLRTIQDGCLHLKLMLSLKRKEKKYYEKI